MEINSCKSLCGKGLGGTVPEVSVIVITRNRDESLKETIRAILKQTWAGFELIIVDDSSEDNTKEIKRDFADQRIRYIRNPRNLGLAGARNAGINLARARFIFFTDDDCRPDPRWLEQGMKIFKKEQDVIVIQGFVVMASLERSRVFRRVRSFNWGANQGNFMCANMAFTQAALRRLGGFDLKFNGAYEDVDIGLRARRLGRVVFSRQMLVEHRQLAYTSREIIAEARRAREQVRIIKYHPQDWDYHCLYSPVRKFGPLKIIHPAQLLYCLVFPVYVIAKFIWGRYYRSLQALRLFPLLCLYILIQRLYIWRSGIQERILAI